MNNSEAEMLDNENGFDPVRTDVGVAPVVQLSLDRDVERPGGQLSDFEGVLEMESSEENRRHSLVSAENTLRVPETASGDAVSEQLMANLNNMLEAVLSIRMFSPGRRMRTHILQNSSVGTEISRGDRTDHSNVNEPLTDVAFRTILDFDLREDDSPASIAVVDALPEITTESLASKGNELFCSICRDNDEDLSTVILELPCKHQFHKTCIKPWFKAHNTCPLCRFQLPKEEQRGSVAFGSSWWSLILVDTDSQQSNSQSTEASTGLFAEAVVPPSETDGLEINEATAGRERASDRPQDAPSTRGTSLFSSLPDSGMGVVAHRSGYGDQLWSSLFQGSGMGTSPRPSVRIFLIFGGAGIGRGEADDFRRGHGTELANPGSMNEPGQAVNLTPQPIMLSLLRSPTVPISRLSSSTYSIAEDISSEDDETERL